MAGVAERRPVSVSLDRPVPSGDIRQPQVAAPFWKSIRFRLAAWYALVMFLVILGISVALHALLERTLAQDARQRLEATSIEVRQGTRWSVQQGPTQGGTSTLVIRMNPPDESEMILSGLWYQFYEDNREPHLQGTEGRLAFSQSLDDALQDKDVFRDDYTSVFTTVSVDGDDMLIYVAPLIPPGGEDVRNVIKPPAWLVVGEPLGAREKLTSLADQSLLMFGISGVMLAAWGGWFIAGRALSPVERITESANAIAVGTGSMSFSQRVDVPETGDELNRLATTFNAMLDRIEAAFRTQQRFVADASHELRSPLTAVRGNVDVLLRQLGSGRPVPPEDIVDDLRIVQRESNRMGRLIEDLLTLARTDASNLGELLKPDPVRVDALAREAYQISRQLATGQELRLQADTPVELLADKDRLVQVIIILMENAIRHTPAEGTITLTVDEAIDETSHRSCARIRVADTGCGIAAEHIPHLFDRFYRVEKARTRNLGGTGLGLSIAQAVVRAHAGWIDVESEPGVGTTFEVWLPFANGFSGTGGGAGARRRRALRLRRLGRLKPTVQTSAQDEGGPDVERTRGTADTP
jgi:signal transduction histidine kinase